MTTKELSDRARQAEVLKQRLKANAEAIAAAQVCNKITMTFTGKKVGEVGELKPTNAQVWGGLLDYGERGEPGTLRSEIVASLERQSIDWHAELAALEEQINPKIEKQ